MSAEERLGCFVTARCCEDCDWYEHPTPPRGVYIMIHRTICPKCGGKIKTIPGRFMLKTVTSCFGFIKNTVVCGFERKQEQILVSKPPETADISD